MRGSSASFSCVGRTPHYLTPVADTLCPGLVASELSSPGRRDEVRHSRTELTRTRSSHLDRPEPVEWPYIGPGKPIQKPFIEGFNGQLRRKADALNQEGRRRLVDPDLTKVTNKAVLVASEKVAGWEH